MKVCEWLGPGYTSINSRKNAFNPYNSVTKYFFFICFENLPLGSPVRTHTFQAKWRLGFPIIKKIKETMFIVSNQQLLLDMK
jgi:hypothetical protein